MRCTNSCLPSRLPRGSRRRWGLPLSTPPLTTKEHASSACQQRLPAAAASSAHLGARGKHGVVAPVCIHDGRAVVRVLLALLPCLGVPHNQAAIQRACSRVAGKQARCNAEQWLGSSRLPAAAPLNRSSMPHLPQGNAVQARLAQAQAALCAPESSRSPRLFQRTAMTMPRCPESSDRSTPAWQGRGPVWERQAPSDAAG